MDYSMNSAGICTACIREYELGVNEDMPKGTVVALENGKAVKAAANSVVLGITAMDYKAQKDELVPGSGKCRVKVTVSPGTMCRMEHPEFAVTEAGSGTTVKASGITMPSAANALKGGYVKLVYKPENSTNTDAVGAVRKITASSGSTITVEEGGTAFAGDIYAILPPAGFEHIALSADARSFELAAEKSGMAKVAVSLPESSYCEICFTNTFFN